MVKQGRYDWSINDLERSFLLYGVPYGIDLHVAWEVPTHKFGVFGTWCAGDTSFPRRLRKVVVPISFWRNLPETLEEKDTRAIKSPLRTFENSFAVPKLIRPLFIHFQSPLRIKSKKVCLLLNHPMNMSFVNFFQWFFILSLRLFEFSDRGPKEEKEKVMVLTEDILLGSE